MTIPPVIETRCTHCGLAGFHEWHDTDDARLFTRYVPQMDYAEPTDPAGVHMGLVVDFETTGLDRDEAEPIELGVQPFSFEPSTGKVIQLLPGRSMLEEPSSPITEEITALTGITNEMVKGQRIDGEYVAALARSSAIVIAHNASFDRRFAERRVPAFMDNRWACSQREIPWEKDFGCVGAKLAHILQYAHRQFFDAHRALDDCQVVVHNLTAVDGAGRTALSYLLESFKKPTRRIWCRNSPYESKERLKLHRPERFEWSDGTRQARAWYVDVKPEREEAVIAFLREKIYHDPTWSPVIRSFGARDRYSIRMNP